MSHRPSSEFVAHLHELLRPFGEITVRRMFGGYGIYRDGLMFGLVADDELFLKTDEDSVGRFEAEGLEPFRFLKKGKPMTTSYFHAPEGVFDDPDAAREWAVLAYDAALRAAARKPTRKRSKSAPTGTRTAPRRRREG